MTDAGASASVEVPRDRGAWLGVVARQRELSLVAIMVVLGALVSIAAPQFLTVDNISQVAVLASIVAVAAVGEALVVITRNVDLSVEAMMGLVAYCVASSLEQQLFGGLGGITGAPQFAGQRAAAHGSRPRDASFSWHVRLPFLCGEACVGSHYWLNKS